jgi:GNAT superfamily N-acetyltransferase
MTGSYIKSPAQCSDREISDFKFLLMKRSEVNIEKIDKRIKRAKYLAFQYIESRLIGIAAIKTATKGFKKRISASLDEIEPFELPDSEIGWLYVSEEYRGKGIGGRLIMELLKSVSSSELFALTPPQNTAMRTLLTNYNFTLIGDVSLFVNNKFKLYLGKGNL